MTKSPRELAAEMQRMAELHPDFMWAQVMQDGAAMILHLDHTIDLMAEASGRSAPT